MAADMSGPYGEAANELVAAGWRGVLPLPAGAKYPPPPGYTGAGGAWPSGADVWAWSEEQPEANIGLRLPPAVLGLDVDAYAGKAGAATLDARETAWGALPPTWAVTSRDDGVSGIRLYRVPPGLWWPGELGPGVEVIQTRHRYVVAPPSRHPEGRPYRWVGPAGDDGSRPPAPDDLSALPSAWVERLSGGRAAVDIAKAAPAGAAAASWYTSEHNNEPACGIVRTTVARAHAELHDPHGSRHDIGMRAVMRLSYLSGEGHRGVVPAIEQVRLVWQRAVTSGASARDDSSAAEEWRRIMAGALAVLAADGALGPCDLADPCANPLAGILMPETGEDSAPVAQAYQFDVTTGVWRAPDGRPVGPDAEAADGDAERREQTAAAIARAAADLRIRRAARQLVDQEDAIRGWVSPPSLETLTDELDLPDEEIAYRVADVIPVGANVVLTAGFKAGKTSMVNHLVHCLADRHAFLGRYRVEPVEGRVALWNYEVSSGQYRRWLRSLGIVNTGRISVLNLRGFTMPVRNPYVMSWAVQWLIDHKVKVWVVDPFARAFLGNGESENNNTDVGMYLETLDQMKEQAGVSELIIPAHTGRTSMDVGTERARGATRLDDWADVRWILTTDGEGNRYFRATGRDVETPEGRLEYDPINRGFVLTDDTRPEEEPRRGRPPSTGDGAVCNAVLAAAGASPGVSTRGLRLYLRNALGAVGNDRVDSAVDRLEQQGLLRVEDGPNGVGRAHFLGTGTRLQ